MSTGYTLRVREPEAKRAEISLEADARGAATLDVRLPVWTPGSYLIREHERHVDGLVARDQDGRALQVEKADRQTWRVACGGARRVRVEYRLGCFELTVRTNHVDPTHAFLNPAAARAFLRAARPALRLRAEERVRGLPPARRARVLPPLEREAHPAGRVHAVRLDPGELHAALVGDGGTDQHL